MTALSGNEVLTFGLRAGTRQGIEAHTFRVETQRDLSAWSRAVVQSAHNAAMLIKEVSCSELASVSCREFTMWQPDCLVKHFVGRSLRRSLVAQLKRASDEKADPAPLC